MTCEIGFSDSPRLTSRGTRRFLVDLYAVARATCHVPPANPRQAPSPFRRFGASIGATPAPIGPVVRALCPKMLEHTHRQTNTIRPTFFSDPPHSVAVCQFSTNLIITFDRNKIQTSNWYHFVSLVKAIRITYNKALTDQVIRGIFKFTTSLYDLN